MASRLQALELGEGVGSRRGKRMGRLGCIDERWAKGASERGQPHLHHLKSAVSAKPGYCPPGPGLCPKSTAESGCEEGFLYRGTATDKELLS